VPRSWRARKERSGETVTGEPLAAGDR
jgi:hypothetical protein